MNSRNRGKNDKKYLVGKISLCGGGGLCTALQIRAVERERVGDKKKTDNLLDFFGGESDGGSGGLHYLRSELPQGDYPKNNKRW
jgi:hypothetical protein